MPTNRRFLFAAIAGLVLSACGRTAPEQPTAAPALSAPKVYTARALRDITVPRTPERVARGQYLTEGLLQCFVCHSERDWTKPGAPPIAATKGAGTVWAGKPWLVAPNLTPDVETGIGRWTDDMLLRAIREGISHDGRVLSAQMWYGSFRALPDADAEAVVAYLRSLKPIRHVLPVTAMPAEVARELSVPEPLLSPIVASPVSDVVQRGQRLAAVADCSGCHSSWHTPKNPGLLGGGNAIVRDGRTTFSSNLTRDPSGIPHYDEALFREVMRTGVVKGRELSSLMPWIVFKNLTDDDLNALFAYLRAVRPVKHLVDNIAPITTCPICGGEHPLGQYNRPPELKRVDYPLSLVRDTVGSYQFPDGFRLSAVIEDGAFRVRFDDGESCALVTEDRKTFFCQDGIDYLEFVRDAAGVVTHVINNQTDIGIRVAGKEPVPHG